MTTPNEGWKAPYHTIRNNVRFSNSAKMLREASITVADSLQKLPPAVQVDALFLVGTAMAETLGLDPHEMVSRSRRALPDVDSAFTYQLQAVRDYAGEMGNHA